MNNNSNQPLFESLEFKDLEGMMKPTIHVDEFSSKMGDDDDIIVVSFFLRNEQAAKDLMNWFEKGYDFVLDADRSPGEIKPNRYLVYVELRRRSNAGANVETLLSDLDNLLSAPPSLDVFIAVLVIYLAATIFLGWLGWKQTKSTSDFMVGGRRTHPYVMAISYGATFISTSAIVGFGGQAANLGLGLLWLTFLNILFGIFLAFILFGKRTRAIGHNLDAHTFPELLGKR